MTWRRVFVGLTVVCGFSVWSWCRADANPAMARAADPVHVIEDDDGEATGGTHDEAAHRFRTNQSRHWRHVMIGGR